MNSSYRYRFLTFFLFLSVFAIGSGSSDVFGQKKRGPAIKAAAVGPADVLLTEDFDYTAGTFLTANGWTAHSGGGTNPVTVTSPGLTYAGYTGSGTGNAASIVANGEDVSRALTTTLSSGTVYAAFMVRVTTATAAGEYFFHFQNGTSNFGSRIWIRKDAVENTFAFGLTRSSITTPVVPVYTAATYQPGTTYLVVAKYTFVAGATNDISAIFINPVPGSAEPAATLTATDVAGADLATIATVGIRQGTNTPALTIDGIRVATTWEEAVAGGGAGPTPQKPNVDMNGDGRTDFVIVRESVASANVTTRLSSVASRADRRRQRLQPRVGTDSLAGGAGQYEWWIDYNNVPGGVAGVWGLYLVDNPVSADFDGDDTDDVAVWRPGVPGQAGFYSINSSDGTFRYSDFGLSGDDATVVGDYDGDGFDDPATFRCPDNDPGQCYFFYRGSLNNPTNGITYIQWGFGTIADYYPYPGDFDGDGKYDFCVQDLKTLGKSTFWLWLNGTETFETVQWGLDTDRLVPGDYDGDGKSDYCVMRVEADDSLVFYILERDGGMRAVQWGIFGDVAAPGDYDGDGKQDIAVHRWNETDTTFWILPSNGDPHWTFNYGLVGDEPVAAWYVQ